MEDGHRCGQIFERMLGSNMKTCADHRGVTEHGLVNSRNVYAASANRKAMQEYVRELMINDADAKEYLTSNFDDILSRLDILEHIKFDELVVTKMELIMAEKGGPETVRLERMISALNNQLVRLGDDMTELRNEFQNLILTLAHGKRQNG